MRFRRDTRWGLILLAVLCGCGGSADAPPAAPTGGVAQATTRFLPRHMAFADARHGWIDGTQCVGTTADAGCSAAAVATDDAGQSWRRVESPPAVADPTCSLTPCASIAPALFFPSTALGFAYGGVVPYLYVTTDGGSSWTSVAQGGVPAGVPPGPVVAMTTVGGGEVWALIHSCALIGGTSCRYSLISSLDGGRSWQPTATQPDAVSDAFATARLVSRGTSVWLMTIAVARGDLRIASTQNDGRTWTDLSVPCPATGRYLDLLGAADARTMWLVCAGRQVSATGPVFVSTNAGVRWAQVLPYGLPAGEQLIVTTPTTAWMPIARGPLAVSRDGGHTWQRALRDAGIDEIAFPDAIDGWALSSSSGPSGTSLWHTADGGTSWIPETV